MPSASRVIFVGVFFCVVSKHLLNTFDINSRPVVADTDAQVIAFQGKFNSNESISETQTISHQIAKDTGIFNSILINAESLDLV